MICVGLGISLTSPSTALALLSSKPPLLRLRRFPSPLSNVRPLDFKKRTNQGRFRSLKCRAEFSQDAPFAIAIGACILNSLAFPIANGPDDDSSSAIDSTDARFAVMGIISFIPYFNWLSWVFAWMDTGSRRYVVYSLVYLAPYLRTNLSLSPEESWLPIAGIIFCIIHVQLEASIRNADIKGFQLFTESRKYLSPRTKSTQPEDHEGILSKEKKEHRKPPSTQEKARIEIQDWGIESPLDDRQHLSEDERRKHKD
ncbi:PREDICTED: uncharacterized protein LOC104594009 [Nelumbo nucifera]|uniref:Uncharacterized protein LOC104594009 n=1 Tax=Nelumbo nucifera TaxID=4432 RepID=A0A1U7ZVD5_NELNU|nr:PREDICTED: uncharacterized protein LOC104594009 [Nelumbo nucifera]